MAKHLKILGKGSPELLGSADAVCKFVVSLIEHLGMRPLGEPVVHDVALDIAKLGKEPFEDEGGVTVQAAGGIIVYDTLSTSHLACHCWPLRSEFHLDIYSCRDFSADFIGRFVTLYFDCYRTKITDLTCATEWD
jgi:S-adenosylmethionine/arginine decarboxylase-like enzyme